MLCCRQVPRHRRAGTSQQRYALHGLGVGRRLIHVGLRLTGTRSQMPSLDQATQWLPTDVLLVGSGQLREDWALFPVGSDELKCFRDEPGVVRVLWVVWAIGFAGTGVILFLCGALKEGSWDPHDPLLCHPPRRWLFGSSPVRHDR